MDSLSDFVIREGKLVEYKGAGGNVIIPEGVVEIEVLAFGNNNLITSVTLPDSVKKIYWSAFSNCNNLASVSVPKGISFIDQEAFRGSKRLADQNGFVVINDVLFHYYGDATAISIPPQVVRINGEVFARKEVSSVAFPPKLREIGKCAFLDCKYLAELDIPESVEAIEERAFQGCNGIKNVKLPKKMGKIGEGAFGYCDNLSHIRIPMGIDTIEDGAFSSCIRLRQVEVSETVRTIGKNAFLHCGMLEKITLPKTLESIGESAFEGCKNIIDLCFPESVKSIGKEAFKGCNGLRNVQFPQDISGVGEDAFVDCDSLWNCGEAENNCFCIGRVLYRYTGNESSVVIPEGIKTIGKWAFLNNTSMSEITLPSSVERIEKLAFWGCTNLKRISLPVELTSIGEAAFGNCKSIDSISIPDSVETISARAFYDCTGLSSIELPSSMKAIEANVFHGCSGLKSINIPEGLETIGYEAFRGCTGLEFIRIPDGVKTIGRYAFEGCTGLMSISIPKTVQSIGANYLQGCFCDIYLETWTSEFTKTMPFVYKSIHVDDFASVPSKFKREVAIDFTKEQDIDFSSSRSKTYLKYISDHASKMTSDALSDSDLQNFICEHWLIKAKDIDSYINEAMSNDDAESLARLLDYKNKLGDEAVEEARKQKETATEKKERNVAKRAKERANTIGIKGISFALSGRLDTTWSSVWKSREELEEYLFHYGAKLAKDVSSSVDYVVLLDGKHTSMEEKAKQLGIKILSEDEFNRLIGKRFEEAEHVIVPDWMDSVPSDAFRSSLILSSNNTMKTVSLPDTIKKIEHSAFYNCKGLVEIVIPKSVTSIEYFAFCGCEKLKKVVLPEGLKEIGMSAFSRCEELSEINIPKHVDIDEKAFWGCTSLMDSNGFVILNETICKGVFKTVVSIPDGVKHVGKGAFHLESFSIHKVVNPITEVSFPDGLLTIDDLAFSGCKLITTLILPQGLERIGSSAFQYCRDLKKIWIPESVTSIGKNAFEHCSKLRIYTPTNSYAEQYAKENGLKASPCDLATFISKFKKTNT